MTPTVGVVLLNYNGLADTCDCLLSLAAIDYPRWFPVVVDNGSFEDPTPILEEDYPGCAVLRNPVNSGRAGGNNLGIRHCLARHADFVILLDNDTRVAPGLIERLAESAAGYGMLRANGCWLMIAATTFRKVGMLDERFFAIHEDADFCLRARRAGLRCGELGEALAWRKGPTLRRSVPDLTRYYDVRNQFLLLTKHPRLPGRGRPASLRDYFKHAYALWERDPTDRVLEGVWDALLRRFGPYRPGPRLGLGLLRRAFEWRRRTWGARAEPAPVPAEVAA